MPKPIGPRIGANVELGARIRAARTALGRTQTDLGAACGCSNDAISHYEQGKWGPTLEMFEKLSDALDVSMDDLIGDAPRPEPVFGPVLPWEQRRSRRKRTVRARTISVKAMRSPRERNRLREEYPDDDHWRPSTRADCVDLPRPCLYVGCKYNVFIDVSRHTGAIKLNFPDLEAWEMGESCALDVADRGGDTLEDVGATMNMTRERIRQLEVKALANLEDTRLKQHADERAGWEIQRFKGGRGDFRAGT